MPVVVELLAIERAFPALVGAVERAQVDDPLASVSVLVDLAAAATPLRRRLARAWREAGRPAMAAVQVTTTTSLASAIAAGSLVGAGLRPLSRTVLAGAVRACLRADAGTLAPVAHHPATLEELVAAYEDLRWAGPGALERCAASSRRGADVARICHGVRAALVGTFVDDVDVLEAAGAELAKGAGAPGAVVVHLPERLRSAEVEFLGALGARADVRVIVATVGDPVADGALRPVVLAATAAGASLAPGCVLPLANDDPLAAASPLVLDELIEAPDPASEARAAIGCVLEALAAGVRADRCALVAPRAGVHLQLLRRGCSELAVPGEEDEESARLAWRGGDGAPLAATRAAVLLAGLLHLAADARLARAEVISWFSRSGALGPGGTPAPIEAWDRCSRRAGVVVGTAARWRALIEASLLDPARRGLEPAEAEGLVRALEELDAQTAAARAAPSWAALAAWCVAALERYLPPIAERVAERGGDEAVRRVIGELAALDAVEGAPDLAGFAAAFESACERRLPHPDAAGAGVLVGTLDDLRAGDVDLLVVVGCNEGVLPARGAGGGILDRSARVAAGLGSGAAATAVADRRRLALALAVARRRVAIWARADTGGRVLYPSRFVDGPAPRRRAPGLVASLAAASATSGCATAELACAPLGALAASGAALTSARLAARLGLAARLAMGVARAEAEVGPFTGIPGGPDLAETLAGRVLSATSLESYAACPFRYFLASLLECEVLEEPEARLALEARDRGLLVHEVLQVFVGEQIAAGVDAPVGDAARLVALAEEAFARYRRQGRTGKDVLFDADRRDMLEWLESERRADVSRHGAGWRPLAVELAFGRDDVAPVERTAGGVPVRFRGVIDRVDRAPDGALHVIDYKTGRPASLRRVREDPVDRGRRLQLPLYAAAARAAFPEAASAPVTAAYRVVGSAPEEIDLLVGEATEERFDAALATLVGAIRAGLFPHRPGERSLGGHDNCRHCDFDVLCPAERAQLWSSARRAERLASYVALAEGGGDARAPETEAAEADDV